MLQFLRYATLAAAVLTGANSVHATERVRLAAASIGAEIYAGDSLAFEGRNQPSVETISLTSRKLAVAKDFDNSHYDLTAIFKTPSKISGVDRVFAMGMSNAL